MQCKTSIGNNSGSIKNRVVKLAYSMGFSAIADRMVVGYRYLSHVTGSDYAHPVSVKQHFECA